MKIILAMTSVAFALTVCPALAQTYTYDNLGRVTSVVQPGGAKSIYYYDNADNQVATQTATSGATTLAQPASTPVYIAVTGVANLRSLANAAGYTGTSSANYRFVVPYGTTIIASSTSTYAIDTGSWPSGVTLSLVISGNVYGRGGAGGHGGSRGGGTNTLAAAGAPGGDAMNVQAALSIEVDPGANLGGGGGGGGGAGCVPYLLSSPYSGAGGGGSGGFPSGAGGAGGSYATHTAPSGEANGGSPGGDPDNEGFFVGGQGGQSGEAGTAGKLAPGSAGGAGASPGYAIRKNGNTVTISNHGTISGTIG